MLTRSSERIFNRICYTFTKTITAEEPYIYMHACMFIHAYIYIYVVVVYVVGIRKIRPKIYVLFIYIKYMFIPRMNMLPN